ncbi:MAG: hypothetical protein H7175_02805 [Burkholderiales bacterium]|nr:hypothetical protein [Anaerolineae bacterium]
MSQQPVLLQIPDELYDRVRQVAENSNRPLENVLLDSLSLMFGEDTETLSPEALESFSDVQLWALVYRRLAWSTDVRLQELTALGKQGLLSSDQELEMERLIAAYDRYVLIRSKALLLLKKRGHDVESILRRAKMAL